VVRIKSITPSFHTTGKIILKVICSVSSISTIVSVAINFNISEAFVFLILGKYDFSGLKHRKVISKLGTAFSMSASHALSYSCSTFTCRYGAWLRQFEVREVVKFFSNRWQEQLCVQRITCRLCVIYFLLKIS